MWGASIPLVFSGQFFCADKARLSLSPGLSDLSSALTRPDFSLSRRGFYLALLSLFYLFGGETPRPEETTSVVRASLVNAKISTPTSLAPSSASGTTVQVHNTSGKPRDRRKQLGFLSRENYYVSDPPVRAGFSIFCQTKIPLSSIAKPGSEGAVQSIPCSGRQKRTETLLAPDGGASDAARS